MMTLGRKPLASAQGKELRRREHEITPPPIARRAGAPARYSLQYVGNEAGRTPA
jgi:hypothetical protein